jgi:hypothetical protein
VGLLQRDFLLRRIALLVPAVAEIRFPVLLFLVVTPTDPATPTQMVLAVVDTMKVALIVEAPLTMRSDLVMTTMIVTTILATDTN